MSENNIPESSSGSPAPSGSAKPVDGTATSEAKRSERRGPPPNPLYHPLFLPVLLVAFSLWFGWDGFLTSDADMAKHQNFNRIMFFIMLPISLWMVPRGIKEFREEQASASEKQADGKSR